MDKSDPLRGARTGVGEEQVETDRERVRRLLIDPLVAQGMRKRKTMPRPAHEEMLDRLERRLGYLPDDDLAALAEVVARHAVGRERNGWPDEVSVMNWAVAFAPPPDRDSRLVMTYLASAAGRRAWEEGPEVAVALRWFLKRQGHPPSEVAWQLIREKAAGWRAQAERCALLEEEGRPGDHATWLSEWRAAVARVDGLVNGGMAA